MNAPPIFTDHEAYNARIDALGAAHRAQRAAERTFVPVFIGEEVDDTNPTYRLERAKGHDPLLMHAAEPELFPDEAEALKGKTAVIWIEGELTPDLTRHCVAKLAERMAPVAKAVKIWDLMENPLQAATLGMSAKDWLASWKPKAERAKEASRFKLTMMRDIEPKLTGQWLVKRVLPRTGLAVIFGASQAGKSFFATDLGWHIATGTTWRDRIVKQHAVIYVAAEGQDGMRNRLSAIRDRHPEHEHAPLAMIGSAVNLLGKDDAPLMCAEIAAETERLGSPVGCIVIDTLSASMPGGSDSEMEDMGAFLANCRLIGERTGALVIAITHTGHAEATRARGHTSLKAAADAEIGISLDPETGVRSAKLTKARDAESGTIWPYKLEPVVLGQDEDGEDVTTCIVQHIEASGAVLEPPKRAPARRARTAQEIDAEAVWRVMEAIAVNLTSLNDVTEVVDATVSSILAGQDGVVPQRDKMHGTRVVPRDELRAECFRRGFHAEDKDEARRKAFQRALSRLYDDNAAGEHEGWIWLSDLK